MICLRVALFAFALPLAQEFCEEEDDFALVHIRGALSRIETDPPAPPVAGVVDKGAARRTALMSHLATAPVLGPGKAEEAVGAAALALFGWVRDAAGAGVGAAGHVVSTLFQSGLDSSPQGGNEPRQPVVVMD
eukprot:CAMPEP_0204380206 /NCGR_PEP_ID=MMETSP0469-20131031/53197_1 /ASSEMBLY_ACC=CAM_ASM_000384 /TAXON_ID=2969 /ORGANISM="Oxyrrhis marina" /LENGTH=132 /DNA_ID=CAMNT_0051371799 /DNA_START=62 /DNA_END=457 /DNA_ORIENTATION=+